MKLIKCRIGDCVDIYNEACAIPDLTVYDVSGVNRDKEFFEPSKQVGGDTSKYKIVPPNYFACNLMHVGRDRLLPIALNHTESNKYVSPAYTVFCLKNNTPLLRDYFFMMLKSDERDRYFWFHTDSSVRDGMSWDDFCDLKLEIPPLAIQQKYVDVYNSMLANQRSYERGLDDLKLAVDAELEKFKHGTKRVPLGQLVKESDDRNEDGSVTSVSGVNKEKVFMPSVASGADISKYKLVKKNQFACNLMHVGRDMAVPIAINSKDDPLIVSPAYLVFDVDTSVIVPEYLLMWLSRTETDRYAWFMCDTNVRSGMEKARFYEIDIPVPEIDIQRDLTDIYSAYIERKEINERLKAQIKDLCPILIKGSIEEARS